MLILVAARIPNNFAPAWLIHILITISANSGDMSVQRLISQPAGRLIMAARPEEPKSESSCKVSSSASFGCTSIMSE